MNETVSAIAEALRTDNNFLLTAHVSPDGDAIGSVAAMAWILKKLGKQPLVFLESGVPSYLEWVEIPCPVLTTAKEVSACAPERIIVLDCGDAQRTGDTMSAYLDRTDVPVINMDHHLNNPMFGDINLVETTACATGELVAAVADELSVELTGHLGEAVYLAISSDTGKFSYNNTTARAHEIAAAILEAGLKPGDFNEKAESEWSFNKIKLWAELFANIKIALNGKVAYLTLPNSLFESTGTEYSDVESIINILRRIENVAIALTVRETDSGAKASMRSHGDVDVQKVAAVHGGGGHKNAAGVTFDIPVEKAVETLLATIAQNLVFKEA